MAAGADFGWNQVSAERSTYNELLGAGKFRLIKDRAIRDLIQSYYTFYEDATNRVEERETEYPDLTYKLVPRQIRFSGLEFVTDSEVMENLAGDQLWPLAENAKQSISTDLLISELNFARFINATALNLSEKAEALIGALKIYQQEIKSS